MLYEKLARVLAAGKIHHAWLLTGRPEQVLEQAVALAQALLCHDLQPDGQPCGQCPACRKLLAGNHPDLQLIMPKGASVKIEQTRAMQYLANLESYEGGRRVVIIHQAHTMPPAAANSLLKILEEPRPGLYFILTALLGDSLLETILSRVVWLRLPENLAVGNNEKNVYLQNYLPELAREQELRRDFRERSRRLLELLPQTGSRAELVLEARGLRELTKQTGAPLKRLAVFYLEELLEELRLLAEAALRGQKGALDIGSPAAVRMAALVEEARRDCEANVNPPLALSVLFLKLADIAQGG